VVSTTDPHGRILGFLQTIVLPLYKFEEPEFFISCLRVYRYSAISRDQFNGMETHDIWHSYVCFFAGDIARQDSKN
jgi:hypothetical protein